jgi:hypothetical protein
MRCARHLLVAVVTAILSACSMLDARPLDDSWSEGKGGTYVWSSDVAEVTAEYVNATTMRGVIARDTGAGLSCRFDVSSHGMTPREGAVGEIAGAPPAYTAPWTREIQIGTWIAVPAADGGQPLRVEISLTPSFTHPDGAGTEFAYDIQLRSGSAVVRCPFHFVLEAPDMSWLGWVLKIIAGLIVGAVILALFVVMALAAVFAGAS